MWLNSVPTNRLMQPFSHNLYQILSCSMLPVISPNVSTGFIKTSYNNCFGMMKSFDIICHETWDSACATPKSEGYPAHTAIAHYKVTARACPQPRRKSTRLHLLCVSRDLHANVLWGRLFLQGHKKKKKKKNYPLTSCHLKRPLSLNPDRNQLSGFSCFFSTDFNKNSQSEIPGVSNT